MQNTFSQSGNDSKWFLTKIIFQNRYVALETPSRPPPFMANAILNFHFDYWHTSLISQYLSLPITIFTLSYLTGRVLWLGSTAQFWVYPPLQLPSPPGWLPQFSPWQWSVLATRWCGVYSQDERQVIFNSSNLPVSATALLIMTFFLLLYFQGLYCGGWSGFNNIQTACNAPDFIPKRGSPDCQWPDWFGKILENTTKCSNFNSFQ